MDAGLVQFLAECQWITEDNPASVIVTGATGTGKTWLIEALGKCACRQGLTVQYFRMLILLELMDKARKDSKCLNFREKINKKKLLIIDDFAILEIKVLLQSTELTMQDIADRLGFPDQSYLGRYFKRHEGMSPREYQNRYVI